MHIQRVAVSMWLLVGLYPFLHDVAAACREVAVVGEYPRSVLGVYLAVEVYIAVLLLLSCEGLGLVSREQSVLNEHEGSVLRVNNTVKVGIAELAATGNGFEFLRAQQRPRSPSSR